MKLAFTKFYVLYAYTLNFTVQYKKSFYNTLATKNQAVKTASLVCTPLSNRFIYRIDSKQKSRATSFSKRQPGYLTKDPWFSAPASRQV